MSSRADSGPSLMAQLRDRVGIDGGPVHPTLHVVGLSIFFLAPGLFVAFLIEWASADSDDEWSLLLSALVAAAVGGVLWLSTSIGRDVAPASIFSAVAWSWIACSVFGAFPYLAGSMFDVSQWDRALFESVSGFTCTGSTVLTDIEANGSGMLMWRQLTQWYGGMGMVVLAVTVLPYLGVGGLQLIGAEATGATSERLVPRVSETARWLWLVYGALTAMFTVALWVIPGVNLYDAVAHAMATAATGGFSTYNASIGAFDSVAVELVLVVGMLVAGMNFTLHYRFYRKDWGAHLRESDHQLYLWIGAMAFAVLVVANQLDGLASFGTVLRDSLFTVATLLSSTGFGNARPDGIGDFVLWGAGAQVVLLVLMTIGGNAGSTAGGFKVFRFEVAAKQLVRSIRRASHPRAVFAIKLGRATVPETVVGRVMGFLLLYLLISIVSIIAVAGFDGDLIEAVSGVISAMGNMGPALGDAGPTSNFLEFSRPSRGILMANMMIGRLEIFAVMLMFNAGLRAMKLRRQAARQAAELAT